MKVISLNTWQEQGPWHERWELIFKDLKKQDADIVGFQEVFNMEWAEEIRKRSGYPYLAVSGEHSGLIFLSKFKPVDQACLTLKAKSPNEDYFRYAFYVKVQTPEGPVALFNTHLSWKADDQAARLAQIQELVEFIKRKAGDMPAVVVGDFNTAPDTAPIVLVRDSEHWIDTYATKNPDSAGLTWDYRNPYAEKERSKMKERRIDYVFITQAKGPFAKIKSSQVIFNQPEGDVWPSDHLGVMTTFSDKL